MATFNEENGVIQTETISALGLYDITAYGAQGGSAVGGVGGKGAEISAEFFLAAGGTIDILVGGRGVDGEGSSGGGGGGATFVVEHTFDGSTILLLVAGGGGGAGDAEGGLAGLASDYGDVGGAGGVGVLGAGGGGSYSAAGSGGQGGGGGASYTEGGGGGGGFETGPDVGGNGGYGGGGGAGFGGGGGGGYGGGAGASGTNGGGGGGSYFYPFGEESETAASGVEAGNGLVTINLACYVRGTRIRTETGEVAIENLALGDRVMTVLGEPRAVRWLGHRALDCRRQPDPSRVWPIRVSAGAFAPNIPSRDLWLSPTHSIAADGVLMPIVALQNGRSVVREERGMVEYWHLELDRHDIVFAEGLPAESYLDAGNRAGFANGGAVVEAYPDFAPQHAAQTCLPLVTEGPEIARVKAVLLARLAERGVGATAHPDLHVRADGQRIDPIALGADRVAFLLPAGAAEVALISRSFIPAHTVPASTDPLTLGVCVRRLQIDGEDVALDDARLAAGWHEPEPGRRWTCGAATLPAIMRLVLLDLAGTGAYWAEPATASVARAA